MSRKQAKFKRQITALGWAYLVIVAAATVVLLFLNVRLIARPDVEVARRLFHVSNLYLGIILLMICVDVAFIEWY